MSRLVLAHESRHSASWLIFDVGQKIMRATQRPTDARLLTAVPFFFVGRLCLLAGTLGIIGHLLFGIPAEVSRGLTALVISASTLGTAAILVRDYSWLPQIGLWACAAAALTLVATIAKILILRQPSMLSSKEWWIGGLSAAVFLTIASAMRFTQRTKKRGVQGVRRKAK